MIPPPPELSGHGGGITRFHDPQFRAVAVKISPGGHYVTRSGGEMLVTVLGSCVAACIRDPVAGVGGMNHFMLPASADGVWGSASASMRYGNFAMERLINDILTRGGRRHCLEIKLFGGAGMIRGVASIGPKNAEFAVTYLRDEGLPLAAKHLGGEHARRINYFPLSGRVLMLEMPRDDIDIATTEAGYQASLSSEPIDGSVELFD